MSEKKTAARLLAIVAAAGLLLSGCATGDEPDPNVAQELTVGLPVATIADLNPLGPNVLVQGNLQANKQLFDTLVVYQDGEFVPSLATEWEVSEDATEWVFTLRDDVAFSDGSTFDAEDVKASMEQVVELAGPIAGLFAPLTAEVRAPDQIAFRADTGQGAMLGKLSMLNIVPAELVAADDLGTNPVGSGPFVVESFDPSGGLVMTANENYWAGAPKLDRLIFKPIAEQAARMTAIETGEIQLTWTLPDDQVDRLSANQELVVESTPTLANVVLWFNSSRELFADAEVRRALWQAIDFDEILGALYSHTGEPMNGPLPDAVFGASEQEPYAYDPDGAKGALTAAGWDFDHEIGILMTNNTYLPLVEAIVAQWAEIGVKAVPDLQEPSVGTPRLLDLDWDMSIIQPVITSTGDADYNLGRLYTCAAKRTGYCDPELDAILAEAGATADQSVREELYAEAGETIWNEAVGIFPLSVVQVWAWSERLDGVELDPIYKPDLTRVSFVR